MSSDGPPIEDEFAELLRQFQDALDDKDTSSLDYAAYEMLVAASTWCENNPSPDRQLIVAASKCESNADWVGAESKYREILLLPALPAAAESTAHTNLAGLYRIRRRDSEALCHAKLATAAARRADISTLLAMRLKAEARCLLRQDRVDEAREAVSEALSVVAGETLFGQLRASSLIVRAECTIRSGELRNAEADLEEAFKLLKPMAGMEMAAGVRADLASCWSVLASLRAAKHDQIGAVNAWQQAVTFSKHVASLPHADCVYTKMFVADILEGLAGALSACDRSDEAAAAMRERASLLTDIGLGDKCAE